MTDRAHRLKRLMFRSHHMGTAENDLLFGGFAKRCLEKLDDGELAQYEALLAENDGDLYKWVTGKEPVPADHDHAVMALIKTDKDSL